MKRITLALVLGAIGAAGCMRYESLIAREAPVELTTDTVEKAYATGLDALSRLCINATSASAENELDDAAYEPSSETTITSGVVDLGDLDGPPPTDVPRSSTEVPQQGQGQGQERERTTSPRTPKAVLPTAPAETASP